MDDSLGSAYRLVEIVGEGGMGTVWRALDRRTGEQVAAKLLNPRLGAEPDVVARFVRERTVLVRLRHPAIVSIRDFVLEGDRIAIVMDLVAGGDLGQLVRRSGTLPPGRAAAMTASLAEALAHAHEQGVVHCDVKPSNVLVDEQSGALKLTDFGISRILHTTTLNTTGTVAGTPVYIAPEILRGERPSPAADVYALGMLLYELLAGRAPFAGGHGLSALNSALHMAPRRLDGMPASLWTVISDCTAKDPAARPPLAQVSAALRAAAVSEQGAPRLPRISRDAPLSETTVPAADAIALPIVDATSPPHPNATPAAPAHPSAHPAHPSAPFADQGHPPQPHSTDRGHLPQPNAALAARGHAPQPNAALADPTQPPHSNAPFGDRTHPPHSAAAAPGAAGPSAATPRRRTWVAVGAGTLTAAVIAGVFMWLQDKAPEATGTRAALGSAAQTSPMSQPSHASTTGSGARSTTVTPSVPKSSVQTPGPNAQKTGHKSTSTTHAVTRTPEPDPTPPSPTVEPKRPKRTPTPNHDPVVSTKPEPVERGGCRSWSAPYKGVSMSPCIKIASDRVYVQARARGPVGMGVELSIELFDSRTDTTVSVPRTCGVKVFGREGEMVTCEWFEVTASAVVGKPYVARERWKPTGGAFGGGLESPEVSR
ncbi:protein kinase [Nonomuraea sp. NPDC005983]|uniref:protein kinase domain-containing protein n=1 Tax=Nonomuraea sp. NPDC005983 TaxID=3155595 RepID=UPI0033AE3C34